MRHSFLESLGVHVQYVAGFVLLEPTVIKLPLSRRANFGSQVHCTHHDMFPRDTYEIHDHDEISSAQ